MGLREAGEPQQRTDDGAASGGLAEATAIGRRAIVWRDRGGGVMTRVQAGLARLRIWRRS